MVCLEKVGFLKQSLKRAISACALCISVWSLAVVAQTEITIDSNSSNLESEYKEELDKWMLQAYEGDRDAQFKVGVLFTNTQFDQPDFEQAVYWYKQAARQGHVLAQYNLGHQYLTGVGVAKNETTAMKWWLEAAKQDHALGQFNIGRAYYLGIGLEEDHKESRYWFERAARNQEPKSIEILQQLGWSTDLALSESEQETHKQNSNNLVTSSKAGPAQMKNTRAANIELDTQPSADSNQAALNTQIKSNPTRTEASQISSKIKPIAIPSVAEKQAQTNLAKNVTNASKPITPTVRKAKTKPIKTPIALYTDPAVRSVLIAIFDDISSLEVVETGSEWLTVSSKNGFPVWVHGDFVRAKGTVGRITGQAVNARSVPIVTNGTVVGRLNQDEEVTIVGTRKGWFRVISPQRFNAWVQADDFELYTRDAALNQVTGETPDSNLFEASPSPASSAPIINKPELEQQPKADVDPVIALEEQNRGSNINIINDNNWLFSQPATNFTLQLASFDDPEKIKAFISRGKFVGDTQLHRFTASGSKNILWTYFLYGSYSDRAQAEQGKKNIDQKLGWIRTFGRLQQNRCIAWKTKLPTPKELNRYCT